MATIQQINAFIDKISPIAVKQAAKHDNKIFASVCIGQACCESAFGTSPKMIRANAVFGIKVGNSKYHFGTAWKDKAYSTKTKECYDGKTYQNIVDLFRAYDSLEEAVEDYFDLICTSKRYKYALNQPTPLECIKGIQKAPYATAPDYVNTIMNIIKKYDLTRFDSGRNPYKLTQNILQIGDKGESVKWLQWHLNKNGAKLKIDGIFGERTRQSLMVFQSKEGLLASGIASNNTLVYIGGLLI